MRCSNVKSKILISITVPLISALFVASPAYADKISINFDLYNVDLRQSGKIYKGNNRIRVRNDNDYGFSLSMYAKNSNLVNEQNSSYKIASISGDSKPLGINQWGYALGKDATNFSMVPDAAGRAILLVDTTSKNRGECNNLRSCGIWLTFGANADATKLATGSYSTAIVYTVVSKPKPSNCVSNSDDEQCVQPYNYGQIPVVRAATNKNSFGEIGFHSEYWIAATTKDWYNYGKGQWAYVANKSKPAFGNPDKYSDRVIPSVVFVYVPDITILTDGSVRYLNTGRWVNSSVLGCSLNYDSYSYKYSGININLSRTEVEKAKNIVRDLSAIIGSPCIPKVVKDYGGDIM